jgi:serum amyloid A protein
MKQTLLIILVLFLSVNVLMVHSMNWWAFYRCVGTSLSSCAGMRLRQAYNDMQSANCRNCDKYFHCRGNYDAVYTCFGNRQENIRIAKRISDCRELAQGSSTADSRADQVANQYGRNGGNCDMPYLCAVRCGWNKLTRTCRPCPTWG